MSSAGDKSTATEASLGTVVEEGSREIAKENSGDDDGEEGDDKENIVVDVGERSCDRGLPFLASWVSITQDTLLRIVAGYPMDILGLRRVSDGIAGVTRPLATQLGEKEPF